MAPGKHDEHVAQPDFRYRLSQADRSASTAEAQIVAALARSMADCGRQRDQIEMPRLQQHAFNNRTRLHKINSAGVKVRFRLHKLQADAGVRVRLGQSTLLVG